MPDPNPFLQAAEAYARSGWYVFPLKPREKRPATEHGLDDATTNLDTIRRWWTKTPTANIGLNCGKSGLVVVDLDKHGKWDGLQEWAIFTTKHHLTPHTSTSVTGGGGRHLLFKSPDGIEIKSVNARLSPGIDVKAEGGYIVLPPSIHPTGIPYAWEDGNTRIEPLPGPVVDILTHEPDPWQIRTLRDAFAKRDPLKWIVDGIISEGSLSIWYGAPGTLKSMLLTDMACCVATGAPWLGIATHPAAVLWLDFDNGQRRTDERISAIARARKLNDAAPIYYVSMPRPKLAAGDPEAIAALQVRIIERNVGLVVIDNLGKISGDADENSADMQLPMDGLRYLTECGAAICLVHHQRKSNGLANVRSGETLRGHGSIEAAIDLAMLVSREDQAVTVTPTKTRGPMVREFTAEFEFTNDEYHELVTAQFKPGQSVKAKETAETESNIMEEVRKSAPNLLSANQVYDRIGGNRAEVLDVIRTMVKSGKLGQRQGPRGYLLYLAV